MMIDMKLYKNFIVQIVSLLFLSTTVLFAQTNRGARISDNTDGQGVKKVNEIAVLDLSSVEKGFLLPRLSTSERNNIQVDRLKEQGLAIYNTTINCIEYYNSGISMWVSLCGETAPAEITILPSQCSEIKVVGDYYQNSELGTANGVIVKITTSKAGAFNIVAKSSNGYSFAAKGKFPTTGTYTVFLKGDGKPVVGYDVDANGQPTVNGDKLTVEINNKPINCDVYVFVNKDRPQFTILSTLSNGRYFTAENVTVAETMSVVVQVDRPGKWVMKSDNATGVLFQGEGVFTNAGNQTVTLKSSGKTTTIGNNEVTITTNSLVALGEPSKSVKATYKGEGPTFNVINCANVVFSNSFYINEDVPIGTTMKVPVRALAPGKAMTIHAEIINTGVTTLLFQSAPFDLSYDRTATGPNANVKEVTLTVVDSKRNHGVSIVSKKEMTFRAADGYKGYECTNPSNVSIDVGTRMQPIISLESPFASVEKPGAKYIPPYTNVTSISAQVYLNVEFYAGGSGTLQLSTTTVNGIKFSGSVTITNGIAKGRLYATGIAGEGIAAVNSKVSIKRDDTNAVVAEHIVDFVYRRMKVASYGNNLLFLSSSTNSKGSQSAVALINNKNLFGWDGVVRIDGFNYLDGNGDNSNALGSTSSTSLEALLLNSILETADIVTLTGVTRKQDVKMTLLYDYLNRENFALIYTDRYNGTSGSSNYDYYTQLLTFIKKFDSGFSNVSGTTDVTKGFTLASNLTGSHFSKLGDNKFLDAYPSGSKTSMSSALFGFLTLTTEVGNPNIRFNSTPSGFSPLFTKAGTTNEVFGIVHNTKGVVIIGNFRPFSGVNATSISYGSPIEITVDNLPKAAEKYGTTTATLEVYNAHYLLNFIHWSIDYAQKNRVPK